MPINLFIKKLLQVFVWNYNYNKSLVPINPSRHDPRPRPRSQTDHTSLWCLKRFYEGLKGQHKRVLKWKFKLTFISIQLPKFHRAERFKPFQEGTLSRKTFSLSYLVINPFHDTGPFLYPLKTSENLWFSDVLWVQRKRSMVWNYLILRSTSMNWFGMNWFGIKGMNWFEIYCHIQKIYYGFSVTLKMFNRSSHRKCSIKKLFFKISQHSQKNNCVGFSLK